jgi:cell division protein FtsB
MRKLFSLLLATAIYFSFVSVIGAEAAVRYTI